jgi:periplasmic mercuric ion binding protein
MKTKLFILPAAFIFLFSCSESNESVEKEKDIAISKKETVASDGAAKTVASIGIEGMTCQAGCARNIQNKLSKMAGVTLCEVSFENKKAIVEFDDSKISEKEMIAEIQKIHGGQYSVTGVNVEKFVLK